jgi:hypothetical protein
MTISPGVGITVALPQVFGEARLGRKKPWAKEALFNNLLSISESL